MFVAEQQLTSLSPRREILCNQNMIARGYAAELSVARSTMRVNSPVPAERRMLSFSEICGAEEMFVAEQQLTSLYLR